MALHHTKVRTLLCNRRLGCCEIARVVGEFNSKPRAINARDDRVTLNDFTFTHKQRADNPRFFSRES